MRTVYATQFEVAPGGSQSASDLLQALAAHVSDWITSRYQQTGNTFALNLDGVPVEPKSKHRIIALAEVVVDHALVSIDWSFPHEPDDTVIWRTQVTIAESGGRVEVAIVVRISSVGFVVKPLEYDLRRPNLVPRLLSGFSCRFGSSVIQASPVTLDAEDVESFVQTVLLDQQRALPVVVSRDIMTDEALMDSSELQDQLGGLAQVAELKTKWAGFELTEALGRTYSCYNGALRIYWPGFTRDDTKTEHTVILPHVIRRVSEQGRSFARQLFRQFAAISAFRFTEGEITSAARAAIEKHRRAHFEELLARSKQKGLESDDQELLELALAENKRLEDRNRETEKRNEQLEADLATYKLNLEEVLRVQQLDLTTGTESGDDVEELEVDSVLAALKKVAQGCNDVVVVYKSAWESASQSDFARPEEVLKAFLAIAEVGRKYFASKGKQSMGPWDRHFETYGLKYAHTDSEMTLNMYGKERMFTHEGRKKKMLKHLRLGKGDRKNCLQIYFEPNDDTKRIEIGYCGRHLQTYSQRT